MKFCPQCGDKNNDGAKFCESCGTSLENVAPAKTTTSSTSQKNKYIAPILNLIFAAFLYCLCGIGHILYLKLYKRGAVLGMLGLIISTVFGIIAIYNDSLIFTVISFILGIALAIYAAVDAYKCTNAINEGGELPLLFGFLNPEGLSKSSMIGVAAICIICLVALGSAIVLAASSELSAPASDASDVTDNSDDNIVVKKDEGIQIKITYPGSWSASIGDTDTSNHYEGTGDKAFDIDESDYSVIAAAVSKKDSNSDELTVEVIKDGEVVDKESTTKDYGTVSVSTIID